MGRRFLSQTDMPTPFPVLLGEWWSDRKAELSKLNRSQLERLLIDRSIALPPDTLEPRQRLLWMRLRLARAEQIDFMLEHNERPLDRTIQEAANMDLSPGELPPWQTNIFYGADNDSSS